MLKKDKRVFLCIKHADNAFYDPTSNDSDRKRNRSKLNTDMCYSIEMENCRSSSIDQKKSVVLYFYVSIVVPLTQIILLS